MRRQWVLAAQEDAVELGIWWAAADVRERLGQDAPWDLVRATALEALAPLLQSGKLLAVDLLPGGRVAIWPGTPDGWLERLDREWRQLGRDPNIGDIAWFVAADKASKRYGLEETH